jgi:hypothetical protein
LNVRLRRFGIAFLLCLALGLSIFSIVKTVQAAERFQQTRHLALTGDVHAIQPWMTLHYVSRVYRVPESYLLQVLRISDSRSVRHVTLYALAARLHTTPTALIQKIQAAILIYHDHLPAPPPSGTPHEPSLTRSGRR